MSNKLSDRFGNRFGYRYGKRITAAALAICMALTLAGCGGKRKINDGTFRPVDEATLQFPLKETALTLKKFFVKKPPILWENTR